MKTIHTLVALHLPTKVPDTIILANHVVERMTGNAYFPTPPVALATVTTHIQALETAETAVLTHAKGTAPARDLALQQVVTDLHQLESYAQTIGDANPTQAAVIFASGGFGTHLHGVHAKPDLAALMGPGGIVILRARAIAKHPAYEWQMSTDGGKTYSNLPSTTTANTSVAGLAIGQTYWFRFRGNVGGTPGDWHDPVALLVH